jgi:hypothetical protein
VVRPQSTDADEQGKGIARLVACLARGQSPITGRTAVRSPRAYGGAGSRTERGSEWQRTGCDQRTQERGGRLLAKKTVSSWAEARERMLERIEDTARRVTGGFPNFADPETGEWTTSPQGDWTGGHWVGELWLARRATGGERYGEWAGKWCETLRPRAGVEHDLPRLPLLLWRRARRRAARRPPASDVALEGAHGLLVCTTPRSG